MPKNKMLINLAALIVTASTISACANDSLNSISEIAPAESNQVSISAVEMKTENALLSMFSGKVDTDNITSTDDLFPGGMDGISVSDIQQGQRPVCYFLSALAGLAMQRPQEIKDMITDNQNGTYTVTFRGLPQNENKVTVTKPDEYFYLHKGKDNSIWAPVVVKAIAQYWSKHGILRLFKSDADAANWGGAWEGIEIVTGHIADFMLVNANSNDRIMEKMSAGLAAKKVVTVSTLGKGNLHPTTAGEQIFSKAHVLTLMKVDIPSRTLTIRDPYGKTKFLNPDNSIRVDTSTDGVFTLSIDLFRKYFMDISIETDKNSNALSRSRYVK